MPRPWPDADGHMPPLRQQRHGSAAQHADAGRCWLPSVSPPALPAPLKRGECARIFTGGEIPPGADCVIMQGGRHAYRAGAYSFAEVAEGNNV
ncbi:hypothetical protein DSL92_00325 [Billgrantia gudaonensis]|uniref:MoeA N-terminal and linker domain-containing protein n=1 Tax=Billgrantia gudaonensis TaxID=376427 RepID=A0A432JKW4_9GAMM|nr:hypothetical protein DSL92_00325 [Halomonas gudaonensis]